MNLKLRIGLRVKAARQLKSMTQATLAERLDRAVETISNIERGHALTGLETLQKIGEVLDVKMSYFFEGIEDRRKISPARIQSEERLLSLVRTLKDSDIPLAVAVIEAVAAPRRK